MNETEGSQRSGMNLVRMSRSVGCPPLNMAWLKMATTASSCAREGGATTATM